MSKVILALLLAGAALALVACGGATGTTATGTTATGRTRSAPVTSGADVKSTIAAATSAAATVDRRTVPRCKASELRGSAPEALGVSAGILNRGFELRSTSPCFLHGSPRVSLLGANQRVLMTLRPTTGEPFFTVTLSPMHPAYFELLFADPDVPVPACKVRIYALRVTPPGDTHYLEIVIGRYPFIVCHGEVSNHWGITAGAPPHIET